MCVLLSDVVSGSAVGLRGRLWQLTAAELRAAAVSRRVRRFCAWKPFEWPWSTSCRSVPDDQVIASRGVGVVVGGEHDAAGSGREEDRRVGCGFAAVSGGGCSVRWRGPARSIMLC